MPSIDAQLESAVYEDRVRFGRSRFLAAVGGGLMALGGRALVKTDPALANHNYPPPDPCYGYGECHYCDGGWCYNYCYWPHAEPGGGHCYTGNQYWEACWAGYRWRCRDWHEDFSPSGVSPHHCVCRGRIGYC